MTLRLAVLLLMLSLRAAWAQGPAPAPVFDLDHLPPMVDDGRARYAGWFLLQNFPRAWAIAGNGIFAGYSGRDAAARALEACGERGGVDCALYAQDFDVVWGGGKPQARPVPGPLVSAPGFAFVPDARFLWHGPAAAPGVYVWAHGRDFGGNDGRGHQPQPHVRAFNNAGWDVVRFDRDPAWDDKDRAATWLRANLPALRAQGWKRIVLGGQSRGAWTALAVLDTPGLADAVIAISPAANGLDSGAQMTMGNTELWSMTSDANAPGTRVAFVQFQDDPFMSDPARRVSIIERLRGRVGALLVLDRPDGFTGHGGAGSGAFAERYGRCLLRFATDQVPPASC